jgi:hypothetical protein
MDPEVWGFVDDTREEVAQRWEEAKEALEQDRLGQKHLIRQVTKLEEWFREELTEWNTGIRSLVGLKQKKFLVDMGRGYWRSALESSRRTMVEAKEELDAYYAIHKERSVDIIKSPLNREQKDEALKRLHGDFMLERDIISQKERLHGDFMENATSEVFMQTSCWKETPREVTTGTSLTSCWKGA